MASDARCKQLLEHLVDLEFAKAGGGSDVARQKAAVIDVKFGEFIATCRKTPRDHVECALAATSPEAITKCDATDAPASPGIGETCGPGDVCGAGTCVKFFGIAGPRGPEFKQCEIKCDAKTLCSGGHTCITIADGPGQVCRPTSMTPPSMTPPTKTPPTRTPPIKTPPIKTPPATTRPKIGENCSAGDTCGEGSCVSYRGIAGARGPEFKTCEIRCSGKGAACPGGRTCMTIADGPGKVCR